MAVGVLLREALVLSHDRPPMHDSVTEAQVLLALLSSATAAAPSLDPSLQKTDVVSTLIYPLDRDLSKTHMTT